jgi:hypothetical protein
MTAVSVPSLTSALAMLRPLSGFERLFLAIDKTNGCNFGITVSFSGIVAADRWKTAFDQVQKRHPLLNAGINEEDPHAPYFTTGACLPIPLSFQRRKSVTDWQRVMESEIADPFELSSGPLLRVAILEDDRGCDLVVAAHHAVTDGMGVLAFVRDVLGAVEGETPAELPLPPSAEERAAEIRGANPAPGASAGASPEPQPRDRSYASRNRKGKFAISALRLSQEQTARLLSYTRREQTTIGAVLSAATVAAVRELDPRVSEADLRLTTALDARPYLGNGDDLVLSIISPRAIAPYPGEDLGASARAIKAQIAPFQSFDAIAATFERVEGVLAQRLAAPTIVNMLAQGFGHDVGISNLRCVEFRPMSNGLRVESVWGPSVLVGYEGEQFIGSATFEGALHLVYSSFTPLAGLLEVVEAILSKACEEA